eukprot:m.218677 g.218677  ORF g.218677 m.218677 type:complete len:283 (+) comp10788_c11_seq1:785-1633(+)
MQRIVVVAGGADAHKLLQVAISSIQEARRMECRGLRLKVFKPRHFTVTPGEAASSFVLNLLSDDVQDFVPKQPTFFSKFSGWLTRRFSRRTIATSEAEVLRVQILFAGSVSNPLNTQAETEVIEDAKQRARLRDRIQTDIRRVATLDKLREQVLRGKPQIVQFSGHGKRRLLEFFRDETTFESHPVPASEIVGVLRGVQCVVLHCCLGAESAYELHDSGIAFVVFYAGKLRAEIANEFARKFWTDMFGGHGVRQSFAVAREAVADENYQLLAREGADDLAFD